MLTTLGIVVILGILIGVIATSGGDNQDTHTATSPVINTGLPPKPDAKTAAAYITALEKIDPAIVSEKDADSLITRGRDQCSSIKNFPGNQAKLTELADKRFTSPEHPDGYGAANAEKILAIVHQYICPTY